MADSACITENNWVSAANVADHGRVRASSKRLELPGTVSNKSSALFACASVSSGDWLPPPFSRAYARRDPGCPWEGEFARFGVVVGEVLGVWNSPSV